MAKPRLTRRLSDLDARTVRLIRAFIEPPNENGCELWTGGLMPGGLPVFGLGDLQVMVRPILAQAAGADVGTVGSGTSRVQNACGTPTCVRYGDGHNVLVAYDKISEDQREDARRRWIASGKSLEATCSVHQVPMRLAYRRSRRGDAHVYVGFQCNECINERVATRTAAAKRQRTGLLGTETLHQRKAFE